MKYALACVALMGCVLMSGKVDLNIEHNMHLPKEFSNETMIYYSYKQWPLPSKRIDIYLKNVIKEMGSYINISEALKQAGPTDEVYFHIAGYGGNLLGMTTIVSAIRSTKASVTMLVEGPSYSGHAYLATIPGVKLIMSDHTFLMFHHVGALGTDCSTAKGLDRGTSNVDHCEGAVQALVALADTYLKANPYLTKQELKDLQDGRDIYLTANVIRERQRGIYIDVPYVRAKIGTPEETIPFITYK